MNTELSDIIVPSIAFFVSFFVLFMLVELFFIWTIRRLLFKNPNLVIRASKPVGTTTRNYIKGGLITFLIIYVTWIFWITKIIALLKASAIEVKIFSLEMLLAILLIYYSTTKKFTTLQIGFQIQRYVYVLLSITIFSVSVLVTSFTYEPYKNFINANITYPVANNIDYVLYSRRRRALLTEFRSDFLAGKCKKTNDQNNGARETHLVYITTDPGLKKIQTPINPGNIQNYLEGYQCSNGSERFILTLFGQWYWVIDR